MSQGQSPRFNVSSLLSDPGAVVALQTVTLVRPMLAPLGSSRDPAGKCFFLSHFARVVTNE